MQNSNVWKPLIRELFPHGVQLLDRRALSKPLKRWKYCWLKIYYGCFESLQKFVVLLHFRWNSKAHSFRLPCGVHAVGVFTYVPRTAIGVQIRAKLSLDLTLGLAMVNLLVIQWSFSTIWARCWSPKHNHIHEFVQHSLQSALFGFVIAVCLK